MRPESKPHSEPSGVVGYTTREFEGGEWVRVEVHEELADRCLSLEEQLETQDEFFRLIYEACGEEGSNPTDWKAIVRPSHAEVALNAVRQLRSDYDEELELPSPIWDDPPSNPDKSLDDIDPRDLGDGMEATVEPGDVMTEAELDVFMRRDVDQPQPDAVRRRGEIAPNDGGPR